jgi:arsenate reductase (thioredoxin)
MTMEKKSKVLFLSTGDATRGQMAEGFLSAMARDQFIAANAAIESTGSDRLTSDVMREAGVDISGQKPLHVAQSLKEHFGYVITLFDEAKERSPIFPFAPNLLRWSLRDPGAAVGTPEQRKEAFRRVRDEIDSRIREFVNDFRRKESSGRATAA